MIPRLNDDEEIRRIVDEAIAVNQLVFRLPERLKLVRERTRGNVTNYIVRTKTSSRELRQRGHSYSEWEFDMEIKFQSRFEAAYFAHRVMKRVVPYRWSGSCYHGLGLDRMRAIIKGDQNCPYVILQVFNSELDIGQGVIVDRYRDDIPDYEKKLSRGPWFWRRPPSNARTAVNSPKQMVFEYDPETGKPYIQEWRDLLEFVTGEQNVPLEDPLTLDYRLAAIEQNRLDREEPEQMAVSVAPPPISGAGEPVGDRRRVEIPEPLPEEQVSPRRDREEFRRRAMEAIRQRQDEESEDQEEE